MTNPSQNLRRPKLRQAFGGFFRKVWIGWDLYLIFIGYGLVFGLAAFAYLGLEETAVAAVDPDAIGWTQPDAKHWFGRDGEGGDLLMRTMRAAGSSLGFALMATVSGCVFGLAAATVMALTARDRGYRALAGITDVFASVPAILLALILFAGIGSGFWEAAALFAILLAFYTAGRAGRWFFDLEVEGDVIASRGLGASRLRLLRENLLPRLWPRTAALAAVLLPAILQAEAALSFAGFGIGNDAPNLGHLIAEGRSAMFEAPWLLIYPGLVLWILMVVLAMLGWIVRRMTREPAPTPVF